MARFDKLTTYWNLPKSNAPLQPLVRQIMTVPHLRCRMASLILGEAHMVDIPIVYTLTV